MRGSGHRLQLPAADFVDSTLSRGENIVRFNKKLIDATKAVAGCYKVQIAYYESLGLEGMKPTPTP